MTLRLDRRFAELKAEGRAGLVTFIMAGDPGYDAAFAILRALPKAGADIIELGMPFTTRWQTARYTSSGLAGSKAVNA